MTNSNNTVLFDSFFRRADLDGDGQISGAEAVGFFQGSGLPTHVLAQAYDRGKNRFCCTSNQPATKDFRSVVVSGNGFASGSHFGDVFSATPAQAKQSSLSAAPSTSSIPVSSAIVPSSVGSQPSLNSSSLDSLQSTFSQLLVGGQSTARPNQQVPPRSVPSAPSTGFPSGSSNAALSQSQPPWPRMTQSDIQKCTKVFVQVDTDRDGKLTGEQVLKKVWDLSDQDNDSMLSLREFCTALYLMEIVLFLQHFQPLSCPMRFVCHRQWNLGTCFWFATTSCDNCMAITCCC